MIREDWVEVELESLLSHVIGGDWGKSLDYVGDEYETVYCIRGAEFKNWNEEKGQTASLRKVKRNSLKKRELAVGDILLEISGGGPEQPVGRTVLVDNSVFLKLSCHKKVCTNFLRLLRPLNFLNSKWVNTYLSFFYNAGKTIPYQGGSNNLRNLKYRQFKTIKIPLAPLPEQRAIVAKIEQLFSELDNGITNLKNAKNKLEIYRQAVLKKAFEGEFTNTNNIEWITLGEVCIDVEYGTSSKSDNEGIVPVLRMGNIQNGQINWDDLKFTSNKAEIEKYSLSKGDVLFNRTNSPEHVGKTAIFKGERESIFAGYLIRINYDKNMVNGHYLNYFLNCHIAKKYGNKVKSFGVNQSNINGTKLKSYPFPKTSLEEQAKIVQEIEARLSVCDNILVNIEEGLEKAEALRQSILKKAFEGRLLSEEKLEACLREPDWEPAEKLFERIKKSRKEDV